MTALWIDLSSHNTPSAANLAAWRADPGLQACVCRLSVGLLLDTWYPRHRANARAAGYLTGAYHALHEGAPMAAQCRKFIANLPNDDELPPWADVERPGLTPAMVAEWFDTWEQETGGREIWFYTGRVIERLVPLPERARYGRYPLVMAAYPNDTPEGVSPPMDSVSVARRNAPPRPPYMLYIPAPWTTAVVHQYTGQGKLPGYAGFVDLSVGALPAARQSIIRYRAKVGPQLDLQGHPDATAWLLRGQPALGVGINIGPPGEVDARALVWAVRNYEDDFQPQNPAAGGYAPDGATAARQYAARWLEPFARANPDYRYLCGPNEPVVGGEANAAAAMEFLSDFHAELVRIIHVELGRVAVVGHFAVGNPDYWLWNYYSRALDAITRYGAFHARHSYGEQAHAADYALRHRKDAAIFAALGYPRVPTLITECGYENLPEIGQRAWNVPPRRTDEEYADHIEWYNAELEHDPDVYGASVFVYSPGWGDHRLNDSRVGEIVAERFAGRPLVERELPKGAGMYTVQLTLDDGVSIGELTEKIGATRILATHVVVPAYNTPHPEPPPPWWSKPTPFTFKAQPTNPLRLYRADRVTVERTVNYTGWEIDVLETTADGWLRISANGLWMRASDVTPV